MYEYPNLADVQAAVPVLKDAIQHRDVPANAVVHAVYVVQGFGLSMYPGSPGLSASGEYGSDDAIRDLDSLSGAGLKANAIPWNLLLPFLMKLLEQWLVKSATT